MSDSVSVELKSVTFLAIARISTLAQEMNLSRIARSLACEHNFPSIVLNDRSSANVPGFDNVVASLWGY
jgi:hypothetical protein